MRVTLCGRSCRVLRAAYDNDVISQAFVGWWRQSYAEGFRVHGDTTESRAVAIAMLLIYAAAHEREKTTVRDRYKAREEAERILHAQGI